MKQVNRAEQGAERMEFSQSVECFLSKTRAVTLPHYNEFALRNTVDYHVVHMFVEEVGRTIKQNVYVDDRKSSYHPLQRPQRPLL